MKNFIVPIFIPNVGCPTRCVFCEQPKITSHSQGIPGDKEVCKIVREAIRSKKFRQARHWQVAFYGGTFTGLPYAKMLELLQAVEPFIEEGYFESIRVSTRPDSLAPERLEIMKSYSVGTVELGAQSLDDRVLEASNRGHSAEDTVEGVAKLREMGFSVGIQLMPGLPEETPKSFWQTVERTILLAPDFVRLYPTVVIKGTRLEEMYRRGQYVPLSLEDAVRLCAHAVERFEAEGIRVIRIGLMSSPTLLQEGQVVAGPWHSCFGYLVRSHLFVKKIARKIRVQVEGKRVELKLNPRDMGMLRGYKARGVKGLEKATGVKVLSVVADASVPYGDIRVDSK